MYRRFLLLIIVFMLIFAGGVDAVTYQGGVQLVNEAGWNAYKTGERLASSLPYYIEDALSNKHYFNLELWETRGLVVYGDYRSIYPNDFKESTLNPDGKPYYGSGEYRYHGYSVDGTKLNNQQFPDDVVGSDNLIARNWVYEPWQQRSVGNPAFRQFIGVEASVYNRLALTGRSTEAALVAKWINQSVNFIYRGTWTGNDIVTDLDPVHYLNIDSAPTAYQSGQGTLLHITDNQKVYYQTFPLARYKKEPTPITAEITGITTVAISADGDLTLEIAAQAEIDDSAYIGNSILESIYYTRLDISEWNFVLSNNLISDRLSVVGIARNDMKEGHYQFLLQVPNESYQGLLDLSGSFNISFLLEAQAIYATNDYSSVQATASKRINGSVESEIVVDEKKNVSFYVEAPTQILDVDRFAIQLIEYDVSSAVERYVVLNGQRLSLQEANEFVSGSYQFPKLQEDRIYQYSINYIDDNGERFFYSSSVIVYDSIPRAQVRVVGTLKENRKLIITADESISSGYLQSHSAIAITQFTIKSELGEQLYYRTSTNQLKEFLSKSSGGFQVEVTVANQYGERNYCLELYIAPDHPPDIIAHVWKNRLARAEALDLFCEAASLDDDGISEIKYCIYYLNEKDEWQIESSGLYDENFSYLPVKLGEYKISFTAIEKFGEETLVEYIEFGDYRSTTVMREFVVDNLMPITILYSDIERPLSNVELIMLLDEGLDEATRNRLKNDRITIINRFRNNGINAMVEFWDLKGYLTEQTAYQTLATGSSYPPATLKYDQNGYSGTLQRTSVNNYPYTVDYGSYYTFTDSMTASTSGSGYSYSVYYKGVLQSSYGTDTPSVEYYDAGGYSGVLYKDNAWQSGKDTVINGDYMYVTIYYTATYSGVVSRSWREWIPDYVVYDDYYGNYSGKVTKSVKQDFNYQFSNRSSKYLVYYTGGKVNNLTDFQQLHNIIPLATTVLIGTGNSINQLQTNHFMDAGSDYNSIIAEIIGIIQNHEPLPSQFTVLLNEQFTINYSDIDYEGDPLVERGLQYVHNVDFLDNSLGPEQGCNANYSDQGYDDYTKTSFTKPGLFTIYRRIKDEPIGYPSHGGYSNVASLQIIAHRAPIANLQIINKYNYQIQKYDITYVDLSYDPDFQFKRGDKGIVNRSFKYKSETGTWIFAWPNQLEPGSYQVEYQVMDCYGVWSQPFSLSFQLPVAPPTPALDIIGYVKHTKGWEDNRKQFNFARSGNYNLPLTVAHFFAGEELVLEAETCGNPANVFVEIVGTNLTTQLQSVGNNLWKGTIWNSEMMSWKGRQLIVRFYAAKPNIPTAYDDVLIEIVDEKYWRQHRLY